jgi:hypothetical protein
VVGGAIGTTVAVKIDVLSAEEREAIGQTIVELLAEVQKNCWEAERTAAPATPEATSSTGA